ncbi:MAG TPA: SAVMC3_10250 family protein [Nitrososphaera sp.]|nr:SAVMC3_10250 family protein [Nitrososphaera sp.]
MKYYIYISDAKVNMLLPQISSEAKKNISTELKFDLKILSLTRKSETDPISERIKRLEIVSSFIQDFGNVGTITNPNEYIYDVAPLRMSIIEKTDLVYLGGECAQTLILLGGSARHLLDRGCAITTCACGSHLIPMLKCIEQLSHTNEELTDIGDRLIYKPECAVIEALRSLQGPEQRFEFLAKRLYYESSSYRSILIVTPLYIALAD